MSVDQIVSELDALVAALGGRVKCPPNCFVLMKGEYAAYESRTSLTVRFPVLPEYLNPVEAMQGGIITAAIDNTMGPLSYLAARKACSTLDLHTQYLRSISAGDMLTVAARVISRGPRTMTIEAEATNGKGKLVARASATMLVIEP
jgi:uncharacterized protein (TIGR00369 family)